MCVDLNIWCADFLARRANRQNTAAQTTIAAIRGVTAAPEPLQLVVSWGMLDRLKAVVRREFAFSEDASAALCDAIAGYAEAGPSLTLGGVGVIPIHDPEDRHVLETAWAGLADVLVTADFRGFMGVDAEVVVADRLGRLRRGDRQMTIVHPFLFAAWLRGEPPSLPV